MIENMSSENRIGVFGGSFNPVHNGHIIIAIRALEELELDRLYIVPAYLPPHKREINLAPYELRKKWLEKGFEGIGKVVISDYEKERGGISYSLFTMRYFSQKHSCRPYLIAGEDSYRALESWYEYRMLLKESRLAVYPRSCNEKPLQLVEGAVLLKAPMIELSSTEIRKRVRSKRSLLGMVPGSIIEEVEKTYV